VPQIVQYPCGFVIVDVYADHLRHIFVPIASEALVEFSRQGCLASRQANFDDSYRLGSLSNRCFIVPRQG